MTDERTNGSQFILIQFSDVLLVDVEELDV
jgi:hypothetical protein